MIHKDVMLLLYEAVKEYDKLAGKEFLIACTVNKNHPLKFYKVQIKRENFWHLLGCETNNKQNKDLYACCIDKKDISEFLNYTASKADAKKKYNVFMKLFNFVRNAKELRIGDTEGTPDFYKFKLVSGNYAGLIGYDKRESMDAYFPKTTQDKSVNDAGKTLMRISFVLSKPLGADTFNSMDYCVSKNVVKDLLQQIPAEIPYQIDVS